MPNPNDAFFSQNAGEIPLATPEQLLQDKWWVFMNPEGELKKIFESSFVKYITEDGGE